MTEERQDSNVGRCEHGKGDDRPSGRVRWLHRERAGHDVEHADGPYTGLSDCENHEARGADCQERGRCWQRAAGAISSRPMAIAGTPTFHNQGPCDRTHGESCEPQTEAPDERISHQSPVLDPALGSIRR